VWIKFSNKGLSLIVKEQELTKKGDNIISNAHRPFVVAHLAFAPGQPAVLKCQKSFPTHPALTHGKTPDPEKQKFSITAD